jgi:hypothetical protein
MKVPGIVIRWLDAKFEHCRERRFQQLLDRGFVTRRGAL